MTTAPASERKTNNTPRLALAGLGVLLTLFGIAAGHAACGTSPTPAANADAGDGGRIRSLDAQAPSDEADSALDAAPAATDAAVLSDPTIWFKTAIGGNC